MNKLQKIENREKNIKLELSSGIVALIVSLIFVFSNHVGNFYQIYYVIVVFTFHQINQAIIFNKWNFSTEYNSKKIWLRVLIITLVLIVAFIDLGKTGSHYSYYLGFTNDKPRNTFSSIVIYCGIYFMIYFLRLKKINKNQQPKYLSRNESETKN